MARKGGRDRGLFERPKASGVWWIRYWDAEGGEHAEKGGNKSGARALLEQRKTEVRLGRWRPSPKANRGRWRERANWEHDPHVTLCWAIGPS